MDVPLAKVQHEHSLILVDLQSVFQNYEEDDDEIDDIDLITMQKFRCTCDVCGLGIDWYHRYYYKCDQPPCSYSLHKFCKLSPIFQFPGHPSHTLDLIKRSNSWSCDACHTEHQDDICYQCSTCDYEIDLRCATYGEQTKIYHPGHPHPLISSALKSISSECHSCGEEHYGVFYHCNTCFNFSIHDDCATLPFKLALRYHLHMLTLSYSFSGVPYHSRCRICTRRFISRVWLYKCSKCRYFVHAKCVTSRREPLTSSLSCTGTGGTEPNLKVDYPNNLLSYPPPDESYNMLPGHMLRGYYTHFDQIRFDNGFYIHSSHNHPLLLIVTHDTNTLGTLHNPITRIKLLCNGCLRPITTTPYYVCNQAVSGCNFFLHEWCTRLPSELKRHPCHPKHPLVLFHSLPNDFAKLGFECRVCRLCCNGFGYGCFVCDYRVDVHCGFIPKEILHEGHPNHILKRTSYLEAYCDGCRAYTSPDEFLYGCDACDFELDIRCALYLPKTIKNKYDKHPLTLSYYPIENHKSEYFCEVCEEELIPEAWFYHCHECGQSIHPACGPLTLQSEQGANSLKNREGVYKFLNMKFGGSIYLPEHQHSLSLFAGTISDNCNICKGELQSLLIFKCVTCKLAFHVTCVMKDIKSKMPDLVVKERHDYYRFLINKPEDNKTTAAITFYPSEVVRPVTKN